MTSTECCGFASLRALHTWFCGWQERLHDYGFVIASYRVPIGRIRAAAKQLVFKRGDLLPFETRPLI